MTLWIVDCPVDQIDPEDVSRFDPAGRTYADCRSVKGEGIASDGLSTHQQVHPADGRLIGGTSECAKHNGRFNYHSGAALRAGWRRAGDLPRTHPRRHDRGRDMTARRRPTVADLRADRARGQKIMPRYLSMDEAAAAEAAGIDIASVPPDLVRHGGLVPSRATFTGGFRAMAWSMGAGAGCGAQFLFAEDILGDNRGHLPRHARTYRNSAAEYDRLQSERIAAFAKFREDVASGAFPESRHVVTMDPREHEAFLRGIGG